jgi:hypothetical protein
MTTLPGRKDTFKKMFKWPIYIEIAMHSFVIIDNGLCMYIHTYILNTGCTARWPGTDVMILKIFSPKIFAKKLAFLTQNKAKFWKKLIITLVFKKNGNFFAKNWEKSPKIVIITSTPDWTYFRPMTYCLLLIVVYIHTGKIWKELTLLGYIVYSMVKGQHIYTIRYVVRHNIYLCLSDCVNTS